MTAPELAPRRLSPQAAGYLSALRSRPRLLIGAALAIVVYLAIPPGEIRPPTRALLAWNAGSWAFIGLVLTMIARSPRETIRNHGAGEDEQPWALLLIAVVAATAAMAAIVWELGPVKDMTGATKGGHLALVGITILSAWTFIHVMFALHYAAEYYAKPPGATTGVRGGFAFPNEAEPGWGEFLYQAFVIGCACATADVNATSRAMRAACLAQGIVAFFFNTVILALTINIGAGFV